MARVSQTHLDARRRQILDGAKRSFTRNGFHATSMQDVLTEAGLSAGAVYRYFSGKDELIAAVASEAFAEVSAAFETAADGAPLRPLHEVLTGVLDAALRKQGEQAGATDPQAFPRLVLQVWGEAARNEVLRRTLNDGYSRMRGIWRELIKDYQEAGQLRTDVPADHIVRTLLAVIQGFIIQRALFDEDAGEAISDGLRALTTMRAKE
ncbi:TetR/AcrR family transcriptional regulator [Streptomyces coelicoflavus]|uniref:TetR/AcrR family transcriptional regulator n=1 Tax=Streptomyces coelicoflavus TaxID=285562 RepID=A0A7K3PVP2_9ACTN|nr:TetR/AcrR family transcriptional regulator [Streptomyces coelicoflavus]NEB13887.1 TetR/AcrR family transcriptional regulator [Streptomyces coelicoflavus]